ncbi:MAG: TIGR00701 family protein [Gammaproteobacteria bacterium RIFCSPLOWO2_02_FULL_52_10]|nr:MAG: TIGR00701 family protein [Gammaproteobacteria bacterium RIFCSPLOWO2_02_FULL_52_10]OGT83066.1 MAG: TIGR00701 family protein [Gammaproteobacteria bacterium RIFCSPLOWO2_12_FULL_52_10]
MLWVKSLHIIFMVTWFAGLFYLPRLYVYHAMSGDQVSRDRFKVMERKLYFGITTPGGILTIIFGLWTMFYMGPDTYAGQSWLTLKLILVSVLVLYHIYCGKLLSDFKHDRNRHSHIWYRWFNEVPVIFLIGIIMLAVIRPF